MSLRQINERDLKRVVLVMFALAVAFIFAGAFLRIFYPLTVVKDVAQEAMNKSRDLGYFPVSSTCVKPIRGSKSLCVVKLDNVLDEMDFACEEHTGLCERIHLDLPYTLETTDTAGLY